MALTARPYLRSLSLRDIAKLSLHADVTFLIGAIGAGKSTVGGFRRRRHPGNRL
ncbi:hypothetical protein [Massilia psychrophila]|uniref:hypothetical protein n=1 Tax=Massilia psychrophila TaxID=1603353 RepID=UPI0015D49F40|nr:hypothetical protein [Massilia psychrophila]